MYSLTFGSFLWSAPVQDQTAHHCFLYFIKLFYIFRALDCDQNATIFWECASKNLTWSHLCECMVCLLQSGRCQPQHIVAGERFHWSGASASVEPGFTPHASRGRSGAYAEREQLAPIVLSLAASARARRCASGGFGFQTKVKDRFLNQRRWTCWYSCRENMQVLIAITQNYPNLYLIAITQSPFLPRGISLGIPSHTTPPVPPRPPPEGRRARVNMLSRGPRIRSGAPGCDCKCRPWAKNSSPNTNDLYIWVQSF